MSYLSEILAHHRSLAGADDRPLDELERSAAVAPAPRPFEASLASPGMAVIAEIKRRSPSKGDLAAAVDAGVVARDYERGGAACLSVLTDQRYFDGTLADLRAASAATALPVLRKDFTVRALDVVEARADGADAVLLIVAALSQPELREYGSLARRLGMAALVEVHDEAELERALDAGATLVGVNQRDLETFAVDPQRAMRVARSIPPGVTKIAESGIGGADDVARLADAGFDGVLVGETLMRSPDRAAAVAGLLGGPDVNRAPSPSTAGGGSRQRVSRCS